MNDAQTWVKRLLALGHAVRRRIITARAAGQAMAQAVAFEGGDTIFAIDRHVEPVLEEHAQAWARETGAFTLVAEGLGSEGRRQYGPATNAADTTVLIDPIDGTRNIMYDKRAAWFIAAVCRQSLADAVASVIVELPTSKQGYADHFAATRAGPALGERVTLADDAVTTIPVRPSAADTIANGFAQVANFFPGTKVLAAELMEQIAAATVGENASRSGGALVFDDQYISTAGQMVELMLGHDRFCCDLRPLFYQARGADKLARGLECHPYDVAGTLAAQRAGVIITDGFGRPLDAPLDVYTGVHWCGYANENLRRRIEPVIQRFFAQRNVQP